MRLYITGYGECGKDHAAEYIREKTGMTFASSSQFMCDHIIFDSLKLKYGYKTSEECFEDRRNHRQEWADLITAFNNHDKTKLARMIFERHDIYVGIRRHDELDAGKSEFKCLVVWIDAEGRIQKEPSTSMTVYKEQADIIIQNRTTIDQFHTNLDKFISTYLKV